MSGSGEEFPVRGDEDIKWYRGLLPRIAESGQEFDAEGVGR
jgi:hypothetical protein